MIIREAVIDDYKDIYLLNKESLGYDFPEDQTREQLQTILDIPTDKIYVAEVDRKVVGYIQLSAYECTYSESLKNILALVVSEEFRKMGIGRKLLQAAEEWAKESGSKGIRLVSSSYRTGAHQFYLNCGYTMRKEQKNFLKWL
ncbi:MAG: GNAT family N-acetyltransferase [Saccharofermentanales bacterium]